MNRIEALGIINDYKYLLNTTPQDLRIENIYYTPTNGEKHDEVVKAILRGHHYEHLITNYNDFTVHVLYADDRDLGVVMFENLDELIKKLK